MALKLNASAVCSLQNLPLRHKAQRCVLSFKPNQSCRNTPKVFCSVNMAAGQSDDPKKLSIGHIVDTARSMWESAPQPVKDFPWNDAFEIFIQLILDLILAVVKYLSIPLFIITSVSEMSYCAHERKLYLILFPFLVGVAVAGILRNAALEASPFLKRAKVPWHLFAVVIISALLKFPGPYYPYWGRIFIPHFANGAIWRTLWFIFVWYRRPQQTPKINQPDTMIETPKSNQS